MCFKNLATFSTGGNVSIEKMSQCGLWATIVDS
jgi:SAM-dependent methyltransferase